MDSEIALSSLNGAAELDMLVERFGCNDLFRTTGGKQEQKSVATRRRLLTATIECLGKYGYAQTTTPLIARRAHMSRGAMLHHYATKLDLIEATIDFICLTRLTDFVAGIRRLSEHERVDELRGLELTWTSLLSTEFQAFMELQIAARTDDELRALFEPKARRFDALQHEVSRLVFPEWSASWERLDLAVDFCQATYQGLLLNRRIFEPSDRRIAVRHLFAAAIAAFQAGSLLPAPSLPEQVEAEERAASLRGVPKPAPRARPDQHALLGGSE